MSNERKKRTKVSFPATADKGQSTNWEFPVFQEQLITRGGIASGIHAVIRGDTGQVIGQYKGVKLMPYTDLVARFESELGKAGYQFTRTIITTGDGARFFGSYRIGAMTLSGEKFERVLRLFSSHDGSIERGYGLEMERLACFNGMILKEMVTESGRHRENDTLALFEGIAGMIERGEIHAKSFIETMGNTPINNEIARNILSNIVGLSKGVVSPKVGLLVNYNWLNPSPDESMLGNSLYRLYNAATRFTRDVEKIGRFELSRRANQYISGAFDLAIRKNQLTMLTSAPANPLDFDGITVEIG